MKKKDKHTLSVLSKVPQLLGSSNQNNKEKRFFILNGTMWVTVNMYISYLQSKKNDK